MPRSFKAVNTQIIVNGMPAIWPWKCGQSSYLRIRTGEEILDPAGVGSSISLQASFWLCRLDPSFAHQFAGVLNRFASYCGGRLWFPVCVFTSCDLWRLAFRNRLISRRDRRVFRLSGSLNLCVLCVQFRRDGDRRRLCLRLCRSIWQRLLLRDGRSRVSSSLKIIDCDGA